MEILFWLVVGVIAGALAKAVVPGEGPGGVLGDLVIGIVGAFLGGWLFRQFGSAGAQTYNWLWSILVAFVGAVVLLFVLRALTRSRAR